MRIVAGRADAGLTVSVVGLASLGGVMCCGGVAATVAEASAERTEVREEEVLASSVGIQNQCRREGHQ